MLVIADGKVTLNKDNVTNIIDINSCLYGCQFGIGIQIGREYWPKADLSTVLVENFKGTATIQHSIVSGYQKGGIVIDGPKSRLTLIKSIVQGAGRDLQFRDIAQNGIQMWTWCAMPT